jgi:hypothetical protein
MLVSRWTGEHWKRMTYVRFQGILDRIHKIRRFEPGGGATKDELIAEHMEARQQAEDDF